MKKNGFGFVAVQLTRKMWMGNTQLLPEDVGAQKDRLEGKFREVVTLGTKKLYPKHWREQFVSLYERARYLIKCNSLPFITEHIRAVPKKNLARVVALLEPVQGQYYETVDRFILHYDGIQKEMEKKYPELWPNLKDLYPDVRELRDKFELSWAIFEIKGAAFTETTDREVQEAYRKAQAELNRKLHKMVEEGMTFLRAKVKETVLNLREKLNSGKIVRNDTLDSVRNVHDWFRDLNVFGDATVEEDLKKLREALQGIDSETLKDNADLNKVLTELVDKVAASADNLEDLNYLTDTYRRTLEI